MGIARFYRWLSERYPLINEVIDVESVPEFDNFYLDMNGIIHNCSHGNTGGHKHASEDNMWLEVFKYVSDLVYRIKPKQLLYLAVDGVAPRAKMNQQRSRRFRSAHDAKESLEKGDKMNKANGKESSGIGFDSNCITPGTEFMARLVDHLEFFVQKKIAEDPLWKNLRVVVSGPDVPGEGEHKIMDYIRSSKSQPGYDPNLRHCLYGLDADLIMLSLASHEPYFSLLREEIDFSFSKTKSKESRLMIKPDKFQLLHIHLLREYLQIDFLGDQVSTQPIPGPLSLPERVIDDFVFFCFLVGNDFLPHLPFSEIGDGGLNKLFACYKDMLLSNAAEMVKEEDPAIALENLFLAHSSGAINFENLHRFLNRYLAIETDLMEGMLNQWKIGQTRICNFASKQKSPPVFGDEEDDGNSEEEDKWKQVIAPMIVERRKVSRGVPVSVDAAMEEYYGIKLGIDSADEIDKLCYSYLEGLQWVYYYYYKGPPSWDWYYPYHYSPFAVDVVAWLAKHETPGIPLVIDFVTGTPFLPFQQLMAVLPPASGRRLLPEALYNLMVSSTSPISGFYPNEFQIDIDGVKVPWGGVTIIPFVDEKLLIKTMNRTSAMLTPGEQKRNSVGTAKLFVSSATAVSTMVASTIPSVLKSVMCQIAVIPFAHADPPLGVFPHWILPGFDAAAHTDFPSLWTDVGFEVSHSVGNGVRVFNSASKQESFFVNLLSKKKFNASSWLGKLVAVDFPIYSKAKRVVGVLEPGKRTRLVKGRPVTEPWTKSHESEVDWLVQKLEEAGIYLDLGEDFYTQPVLEFETEREGEREGKALAVLAVPARVAKVGSIALADEETHAENPPTPVPASLAAGLSSIVRLAESKKQWFTCDQVARELGRSSNFVWALFGEVWVRAGRNQEEIGMNFWSLASTGEPQCVAGFSKYAPKRKEMRWNRWDTPNRAEWFFAQEAVHEMKQYANDWPEVMDELTVAVEQTVNVSNGLTLQGKRLFNRFKQPEGMKPASSQRDDWVSEYYLNKLVSYVNASRFKTLSLCPFTYAALNAEFVSLVDAFVTQSAALVNSSDADAGSKSPAAVELGDRGIYTKTNGHVPVGTWGTVIGVYGNTESSFRIDVLLDKESLSASSLSGTCPEMRGIRIIKKDWQRGHIDMGCDTLKAASTKLLADLIVQHGTMIQLAKHIDMSRPAAKQVGEPQSSRPATKQAAAKPQISRPAPPQTSRPAPLAGTKINVADLFAKPVAKSARPLPPTAKFEPVPEFLMSKLRK